MVLDTTLEDRLGCVSVEVHNLRKTRSPVLHVSTHKRQGVSGDKVGHALHGDVSLKLGPTLVKLLHHHHRGVIDHVEQGEHLVTSSGLLSAFLHPLLDLTPAPPPG